MAEVLNNGLDLVISEEIDGEPGWVKSLLKVSFEGCDYESDLEVGVGCEYFSRVHFFHFKVPVVEDDDLVVELDDVDVAELLVELADGLLGEVAGDKEITIGD